KGGLLRPHRNPSPLQYVSRKNEKRHLGCSILRAFDSRKGWAPLPAPQPCRSSKPVPRRLRKKRRQNAGVPKTPSQKTLALSNPAHSAVRPAQSHASEPPPSSSLP